MLADSHCHLNYKGLAEDQQAVLERARARGVTAMLKIATREREWDDDRGRRHDRDHWHERERDFCPPGQAKKGNC